MTMNPWLTNLILADSLERIEAIQQFWIRERDPRLALAFWAVVCGMFAVFLLATVRHYRRRDPDRQMSLGPWALFFKLLGRLPLTWAQRWTLAKLARRSCPATPAAILLTPSALRRAGLTWAGGQESLLWNSRLGRRLGPIGQTLFDRPLGPEE